MSKKLLAIVLVLAMVLALPAVAMADNLPKPVATRTTTRPSSIQSVTIGGVTASYYEDGYLNNQNTVVYDTTQVFIRATMPATNTEESLKTLDITVAITTANTLTGGSLLTSYSDYDYNTAHTVYDFYDVDLLNNSYTIIVNGVTYIIAAGIDDSDQEPVAIPSTDPLSISNFSYNGTGADVYRTTVQNPCMGNPYYVENSNTSENGWTFCNYFIKALNVNASNLSSVSVSFTRKSGASLSGNISNVSGTTSVTATANLSVSYPILTVTKNGNSRSYNMIARVATSGYIWVTYGFSFDELKTATDYYYTGSTVKTKADKIASDAAAYFGGTVNKPVGDIQVPAGSTAMDVVQAFMYSAGYSEYDPDSTYISSIYGLAAFDTTGMDGWMYTDDSNNWSYNWHLPSVGAADWYLSAGDHITWFFTTDFTAYTNW